MKYKIIFISIILYFILIGSCGLNPFTGHGDSQKIIVPSGYFPTIQKAIDWSSDGDTIVVLPGTYKENLNMKGKNVLLTSLYYENNDRNYISETIIDGKQLWSVIVIDNGESEQCVINGFTLKNGIGIKVQNFNHRSGGAIYCRQSNPTLKNLFISNNSSNYGSAICLSDANAIIENVIASNNTSTVGTIFLSYSRPDISNVTVTENNGQGMILYDCSDLSIQNMFITKNSSVGVTVATCYSIILEKMIVAENQNTGFSLGGGEIKVLNSTCVNNSEGISVNGDARVENSILFNLSKKEVRISQEMSGYSSIVIQYSNVKNGPDCFRISGFPDYIWTKYDSTNFSTDPKFCDPENSNYHISATSPCVDGGENGNIVGALGVGCD